MKWLQTAVFGFTLIVDIASKKFGNEFGANYSAR